MQEIVGTPENTFGIRNCRNDNLLNHEATSLDECSEYREEEQTENTSDSSSIDIISNTCRIYKYYSGDTVGVVQSHFTRSLQEHLTTKPMNSQIAEGEIQAKTTGRSKRKPKRRMPITSSTPKYVQQHASVMTTGQSNSRFILPRKVEKWYTNVEPRHYTTTSTTTAVQPAYIFQCSTDCTNNNIPQQSAYSAFCNGKTIVEIYSPTVGRGFNPRFNSLLLEPTVKPVLPAITGQPQPPSQAEMQAFMHLAIGFDIPKQQQHTPESKKNDVITVTSS